jgi:hypothetical protein
MSVCGDLLLHIIGTNGLSMIRPLVVSLLNGQDLKNKARLLLLILISVLSADLILADLPKGFFHFCLSVLAAEGSFSRIGYQMLLDRRT